MDFLIKMKNQAPFSGNTPSYQRVGFDEALAKGTNNRLTQIFKDHFDGKNIL